MATSYIKILLQEFGQYFQYIFIALIIWFFYKKVVDNGGLNASLFSDKNNEESSLGSSATNSVNTGLLNQPSSINEDDDYEFDEEAAKADLKSRIRRQLRDNFKGIDEEELIRYELLMEELSERIQDNPEDSARVIDELIKSEGTLKSKRIIPGVTA